MKFYIVNIIIINIYNHIIYKNYIDYNNHNNNHNNHNHNCIYFCYKVFNKNSSLIKILFKFFKIC